MSKVSMLKRQDYGKEQFLVEALVNLEFSNSAKKFLRPVDPSEAPGYYERIRSPMDLLKILQRFREGFYSSYQKLKSDLKLILDNCQEYNVDPALPIRKKAEKFGKEIEGQLLKYETSCLEKGLDPFSNFTIGQSQRELFLLLEERRNKKRMNIDVADLMPRRTSKEAVEISMQPFDRPDSMFFQANMEQVRAAFALMCQRKLKKYQKLVQRTLENVLMYLKEIIKKHEKLQIPRHLHSLIEEGELQEGSNIRKFQLFVKQLAYWVRKFHVLLQVGSKLILARQCRMLRKCIKQVVIYKDSKEVIGGTGLSAFPLQIGDEANNPVAISEDPQFNYDSKMKEFRRMLERDEKYMPRRDFSLRFDDHMRLGDRLLSSNKKKKVAIQSMAPTKFEIKLPDALEEQQAEDRMWAQKLRGCSLTHFSHISLAELTTGIQEIQVSSFALAR